MNKELFIVVGNCSQMRHLFPIGFIVERVKMSVYLTDTGDNFYSYRLAKPTNEYPREFTQWLYPQDVKLFDEDGI